MKKLRAVLPFLILLSGPGWSLDQKFLEPITPVSSALRGQGSVWAANTEGWDALFANPAAFATDKTSLTVLQVGALGFVSPSGLNKILANRDTLMNLNVADSTNPNSQMLNSFLTTTGLGAEATVGGGWVGNNWGGGLLIQDQTYGQGLTLLGSTFKTRQSIVGVIGYAWPFEVPLGKLKFGFDARPEQVSYSTPTVSDLVKNLTGSTISSGFGLGLDMGARWEYDRFKTGLVIRDLGSTVINFNDYSFSQWTASAGMPLTGNSASSTVYRIPMVVALGTSYSPDMGALTPTMKTTLSADLQVPLMDQYTQPSFWAWTHLGVEAHFLDFLSVRTGLNQGYFTFGLGTKVMAVDFNLAISTDELGRYSGATPRPALSVDLGVHL